MVSFFHLADGYNARRGIFCGLARIDHGGDSDMEIQMLFLYDSTLLAFYLFTCPAGMAHHCDSSRLPDNDLSGPTHVRDSCTK